VNEEAMALWGAVVPKTNKQTYVELGPAKQVGTSGV